MRLVVRNRGYFVADLLGLTLLPTFIVSVLMQGVSAVGPSFSQSLLFGVVSAACMIFLIWATGLYGRFWRYASIEELTLIAGSVATGGVAAAIIFGLLVAPALGPPRLPPAMLVISPLFSLMFVGGTRFAIRLAEYVRQKLAGTLSEERVLIVGAGRAGAMIARELRANRHLGLEAVGFVDDDPAKHGSTIHGVPVLGGRDCLPALARDFAVRKVVIAMPTAPGTVIREFKDICARAKLETKTIPGFQEIISGRVSINQLRDVQIDDLLRRRPVETDRKMLKTLVRDTTVLVTGAGGSIGSEICRQVAELGARRLVLLGHGENGIFDIHGELRRVYPDVEVIPVIADIRHEPRIRRIFEQYRPDTVFHAAAHKHVPLMESNAEEAVTNNVGGTFNVLSAAESTDVQHFVLISTDKAVHPVNVMGATKLLAEQLAHQTAVRTGRGFVSVRFGNVLASRGSVVPVFQEQIRQGGPITVTHPDMTRYFMTIPEAVQLVLQAAAIGKGGETFVLDMAEPVKIVQLAQDLVKLSGLDVDRDIKIVFTGLRPGEKLSEELFTAGETASRTAHEKIFVVRNGTTPPISIPRVQLLVQAAVQGDETRMRELLASLVHDAMRRQAAPDISALVPASLRRTSGGSARPDFGDVSKTPAIGA